MKMKIAAYFVVVLFLIGSITAVGIGKQLTANEKTIAVQFSAPKTTLSAIESNTYIQLNIGNADQALYTAGEPILPMYTTVLEFPLGTIITSVECIPQEIQTMTLPYKIMPAPEPIALNSENPVAVYSADQATYNSAQYFPDNWVDYSTGGGLNSNNQHTTFLSIRTFPARYSPATDTIQYMKNAEVKVSYKNPEKTMTFGSGYQLVIIAPAAFSSELTRLVDHKIAKGINTTLMTIEDIYNQYTGYDSPEQIKYFIKYALDTWNTQYVLLVGGMNGYLFHQGGKDDANQGTKDWYLPVRYTNLDEGGTEHDPGYISDLYYADIYDSHGNFSSWDSNNDHIYAKWRGGGKDIIDLYPDLAVGRLPCRNTKEVKLMVDKIITYESTAADPSWFNKIVLVGGDSFDDRPGSNMPEGEVSTEFVYNESMAASFTDVQLFATNRNISNDFTPTPKNIERVVSAGCGFLYYDGHGSPASWNTHWVDEFTWANGKTPGGTNAYGLIKFRNGDKLPVCVVGGCHNSMLNVSFFWTLDKSHTQTWTYGVPLPRSWSEWMIMKNNGGAIACMGNTGLGYGFVGTIDGEPACYQGLGGYVERTFFKSYNESSSKTLGDAWVGAITKYLVTWPGMLQQADCKTVEEWIVFGDSSLRIGGYSAVEGILN
ncbi:MAG TPA: hypothetical protein DSN98_03615 [Thermoplasmata archaeon]|nr:MAG TPA: hypothetical protein DSN98_03615 [Thermoplasmata archaeon]